jgi:Zn-dependent protease with chaperone function
LQAETHRDGATGYNPSARAGMGPGRAEDPASMAARTSALLSLVLAGLVLGGCDDAFAPPPVDRAAVAAATREIAAAPPARATPRTPEQDLAMLGRVAERTIRAAQPLCHAEFGRGCAFRVALAPAREANAFAHGEDGITVTTGLMRLVANEDELAAVVAHEIAHHLAGHIQEGTQRAHLGAAVGAVIGGAVTDLTGLDLGFARIGAQAGAKAAGLAFSKAQEREADYLGAHIAARAGYDLDRAGALWAKLTHLSGDTATSWLDTHPAGPERLAIWRRTAAEIARDPAAMPRRGGRVA